MVTVPAHAASAAVGTLVGVEAVKGLGVELVQRHVSEGREDVAADVTLVPVPGGQLQVGHLKPARQQVAHGPTGGGRALLINLTKQARQGLLGFVVSPNRLAEVALFLVIGSRPA
jgi:hypothetical protein